MMEINKMLCEQNLNERVAILEAKVAYLSKIFLQIGETIGLESISEAVAVSDKEVVDKMQEPENGECHEQAEAVPESVRPLAFDSVSEDNRSLEDERLFNKEREESAEKSKYVSILGGVNRRLAEEQEWRTFTAEAKTTSEENATVTENFASEVNIVGEENSPLEINAAVKENTADDAKANDMQLKVKAFMAAYNPLAYDNDDDLVPLEVEKAVLKKLNNYLEWQQVPANVKEEIKLVDSYESTKYYARCEQLGNEFIYMVTPVQPDVKYSPKELKNLGLPYFFEIEYARETYGQMLVLLEPAIFKLVGATYVLYQKGKLRLAR